jgi:molecular chaperone Hsp33
VSDDASDSDVIRRFSFAGAPIRGQWVRLTQTLAVVFSHQPYPPAVRTVLAELLGVASLLADGIKFRGTVALQARGTGPVTTVLAECRDQHLLRGIGRWNHTAELVEDGADLDALLGNGQMAVTLIPDPELQPEATTYQGVVDIAGGNLAASLEDYFVQSEQLPTRLFLAFDGAQVTGLLLQRLPTAPGASDATIDEQEELWREVCALAGTLTASELARWSIVELVRKLFHEHSVKLHAGRALEFACTCGRERAERMLAALPKSEILGLLAERGAVDVTCEICGARYEYDQIDTRLIYEPEPPKIH